MPRHHFNVVDSYIGNRIRARRLALGMTQTALGNRVSGSRMQLMADTLQVKPHYFFEGAPRPGKSRQLSDAANPHSGPTHYLWFGSCRWSTRVGRSSRRTEIRTIL